MKDYSDPKNFLPKEEIMRTDFILMAFNQKKFNGKSGQKRPCDLACGHKVLTSAWNRTVCPRCVEMMKRSINGGEEDWDGFRHRGGNDTMIWREDPLREFNDRTDLAGTFYNP